MSARSSRARARRRAEAGAGFTLVELMIALVVGGMVIGAMYAVSAASTRHFQVQHQVANMQSALRFAYVQVKRDFMRAGYQATARAELDQCTPSGFSASITSGGSGWIAGVSSFRNNIAPSIVDPTGNNAAFGFTSDEIVLTGNYTTSNEYPGVRVTGPATITLDINPTSTWHSIQSDFGWSAAGTATPIINAALVANAFPAGQLIRIQTTTNQRHYAQLVADGAVGGNVISLAFQPPLPPACQAIANDGWVAPLNFIRYYGAMSNAASMDTDRVTGSIPQLLRAEVQPGDKVTPVLPPGPTVILDYLAAFNLAFTMNRPGSVAGQVDDYQNLIGQPVENNAVNDNPELVRAIRVELAVRAPSTDPGAVLDPGLPPLVYMQLFAESPTRGARVRWLRSEIFIPNIAYEGY